MSSGTIIPLWISDIRLLILDDGCRYWMTNDGRNFSAQGSGCDLQKISLEQLDDPEKEKQHYLQSPETEIKKSALKKRKTRESLPPSSSQ